MEKMIADFLQALPDGALIISHEGLVTASNHAAKEALELDPDGLPASSVIRSSAFTTALAVVRSTHRPAAIDFDIYSNPPRSISAHIAKLEHGDQVLVILRDLTRAQTIEKMRSDFVANASHEMRTPLSSILGAIETLQGPAKNDAKGRDMFLATMLTQAQRMKRLIDDLLTLSRIELNAHVRPSAKVSLPQIAKQARSNLGPLAKELAVEVSLTGDAEVLVSGDGEELLQVAQNLLENAIKYGSSGKHVVMSCADGAETGTLSIQDFGKGIAQIHLPRLTERFYRVSTQESRQRGGTGLGTRHRQTYFVAPS